MKINIHKEEMCYHFPRILKEKVFNNILSTHNNIIVEV